MKKEKVRKSPGKVLLAVLCWILGIFLGLALILFFVNVGCALSLRNYIRSFDPVEYGPDRIAPYYNEDNGYYEIKADGDLKIMQLTDIHLGGGFYTYKRDKKTIYEVITMLQKEKPDIVVATGDNTFCVPAPFDGGNTFNNKMTAKTVIDIFEHEKVYFTTTFGNHDTESFDFYSRQQLAEAYMDDKYEYCFFDQDFTDPDADTVPSATNQIIPVRGSDGKIKKIILLIDTNAYLDTSLSASLNWEYDTIHDVQVDWAADAIKKLSKDEGLPEGTYLKTVTFMHIPISEYKLAYDELVEETENADGSVTYTEKKSDIAERIFGWWDEKEGICCGGWKSDVPLAQKDKFFEVLSDEMGCLEAVFCGHDHVNNVAVRYKGVILAYGYSIDNTAYSDIRSYGFQRGATIIDLENAGGIDITYKNAYADYGCDPDKFYTVDTKTPYYTDNFR